MSKRFTETTIWKEQWYRELTCKYKEFWRYLYENCDNAGIWSKDISLASFYIGEQLDEQEFLRLINKDKKRIKVLNCNTKWLIIDYVPFQIGNLNGDKLTNLQKNSLFLIKKYLENGKVNQEDYPIITRKLRVAYGYKYKGIGKGISKDKSNKEYFKEIWTKYPNKDGKKSAERHFKTSVKTQEDWDNINKALQNYLNSENMKKGFVKNGSTWFNNWQDWIDFKGVDKPKQQNIPEVDKIIQERLGKIASLSVVIQVMRDIPQHYWGRVSSFLCKRYSDGSTVFGKAEAEIIRETK